MSERYSHLLEAIEAERIEEERHHKSLLGNKSLQERVDSGMLWYPVVLLNKVYTVGEQIELTFERTKNLNVFHRLKSGAGCNLFRMDGATEKTELRAVISYVKRNKIGLILSSDIVSKSQVMDLKGQIGVELIYDDRPYQVMKEAIKAVINSGEEAIRTLMKGIEMQSSFENSRTLDYRVTPSHLNESQIDAVNGALCSDSFTIIHGPPGTGKTTTLVSVVRSLLKSEKRVLVCAPSNNAVDLLAIRLDQAGLKVLRIGNVTRIGDDLTHLTLAEQARDHPDWKHIKKVRIEADKIKREAGKYKRKFGQQDRIDRKHNYRESRELVKWARELEDRLTQELISGAQVICSTLIGVSHRSIAHMRFETLVIDEASQALEPECWNAMLKAQRVILAGDHLQLSPTVKSSKAQELGLSETLLTRMTNKAKHSYLLNIQYRMNEHILAFSNFQFYDSKLKSHPNVAERLLDNDDEPLIFIDTSGCGFEEDQNPKSLSRYNKGEYFILREHFIKNIINYEKASIGIISPYSEQVKFLRSQIEEDELFQPFDVRINSIDGFQGQERDVIYITLVRSNSDGEIGFLADERRLNVAMTRAKKKLIIIGDLSTLSRSKLFDALGDHIEKQGTYQSAWEYMAL